MTGVARYGRGAQVGKGKTVTVTAWFMVIIKVVTGGIRGA
jgi:hypothetical protein